MFFRSARLPYLVRYARDLTDEARQGLLEPVVGRAAVLERMAHVLLRRTKNNPLLLGDPGVGKTAVVEALANAIAAGTVRSLPERDPCPARTGARIQAVRFQSLLC